MRDRKEIERLYKNMTGTYRFNGTDIIIELLLDIRELLASSEEGD